MSQRNRIVLATALQSKADDRPERIERAAGEAISQLEDQINELNRLINDLRPAPLERLGLAGALRALAEESSARGGIEVETTIELGEETRGEEERIVYRLVQESLNNVLKHAGASRVAFAARQEAEEIQISIADDGAGFDPTASTAGRGLTGMKERIELLGGQIEIDSSPGNGTRISAQVPVQPR